MLDQNYPNPFNAATEIRFGLPQSGRVELAVFNILGQHVRTLMVADLPAVHHDVLWNGRDENGCPTASGINFCWFQADAYRAVRGMTLLK